MATDPTRPPSCFPLYSLDWKPWLFVLLRSHPLPLLPSLSLPQPARAPLCRLPWGLMVSSRHHRLGTSFAPLKCAPAPPHLPPPNHQALILLRRLLGPFCVRHHVPHGYSQPCHGELQLAASPTSTALLLDPTPPREAVSPVLGLPPLPPHRIKPHHPSSCVTKDAPVHGRTEAPTCLPAEQDIGEQFPFTGNIPHGRPPETMPPFSDGPRVHAVDRARLSPWPQICDQEASAWS
ncbi:hypothetical protein BS78_K234700 [Paspalum vaginatum]|uniref:Uncharacterized protein n=1 Tax=Paspalum vaginatum TaxID=158149 RepID=A0A9W7X6T8_9POAL|nr:hypothetical protein BS78_K234700 [Paspalum vaginatum]